MSRLLQVVIALVGLAITGVLGLASGRSEALQARHTLIGLFTETVSAARTNCDRGLAQMAVAALEQLENLENDRMVLTPGDRKNQDERQRLLANYQDYMAEVQGTIDSGACGATTLVASNEAPAAGAGSGALSGPAPNLPSSSVLGRMARESANIELRRAEEQVQVQAQVQAQPPAPSDDAAAPATEGPGGVVADAEIRARVQLRPASAYYAVLASYPTDEASTYDPERGVVAHYRQLRQTVDGANVRMFQTGATNRFVIVVASDASGSRVDARRQVANARARGWSPDALVQPAYDWTECAQPERITRQTGCVAR